MANNRFEELPPDHIAPVFAFCTGVKMGPSDIESHIRNAQMLFRIGIVTRVFSDERLPLPEGVISLDDARRDRQVQKPISRLPKPCLSKIYASPGTSPDSSGLPMQPEPLRAKGSKVFSLFVTIH